MKEHKKKRDEEEEYFQRENLEKKEKLRRKQQLQAIQQQERESIAKTLATSQEIADEAMDLGFDAETARVLPLIPLIQVAWADGKVTLAQSEKVLSKAEAYGVAPDTPAHDFLSLLLDKEPSTVFFKRANKVIKAIVDDNPGGDITTNVLPWSQAVAEASGGFFGLTNPISKKERSALSQIASIFNKSEA